MENNLDKTEKKGFIAKYAKFLVILAVFFGGTSGNFGALISAPSQVIGFWRLVIALPFFAVPIFAKDSSRQALRAVSGKNLLLCFIAGAFLFAHYYSWYNAVKMTNISSAAILASFHPLVVIFVTLFIYKKKIPGKSIAAILVALAGGILITCADFKALSGGDAVGDILGFVAGICMGVYFAMGGKIRQEVEGPIYVLLVFFSCMVCFAACNIVTSTPVTGYPIRDYVYILCLALLCQIGSHAVWNLCMGSVSSLYVSAWETADPVVSTVLAVFMVRQIPSVIEVVGCIIVVCALLMYNKFEAEASK